MKILIYLRSIAATFLFIIITVSLSVSAILFDLVLRSKKVNRWHIKSWGRSTCFLFGVKVSVQGFENWPFDKGAVVLFNHTSFFDIFAMVGFLPDMRFGAKQELFKIPFFGSAMKQLGILPIDRARRDKVFQIYENSTKRLQEGEKIALAPEGGRTHLPSEIGPFKAGPFIFALQAGVDLVPVVIRGAFDVLPKGAILPSTGKWSYEITLKVLKSVPIAHHTFESRSELQVLAREKMQDGLKTL